MTSDNWHLDKKVPIAVIIALVIYFIGGVWWAARLDSRFDLLINQIKTIVEDVKENKEAIKEANSGEPRLVRVETELSFIRKGVDDNKSSLKQLDDKLTELLRATRSPP